MLLISRFMMDYESRKAPDGMYKLYLESGYIENASHASSSVCTWNTGIKLK